MTDQHTDQHAAQRTYPEGVTSWVDTEQADVDAAAEFYGGLFGWTFTQATPSDAPFRYLVAQLGGRDVGGLGGPATPPGDGSGPDARWNTYVAVTDAEATARRVEDAGGEIVQPPTVAGEGGRSVVLRDPHGLEVRLWEARRRLGAQATNVPGAWNFSDLHTGPDGPAKDFYASVFGWEFDESDDATMIRVPGYGDHLASTVDPDIHERQSGAMVPPGFADAIGWVAPAAAEEEPGWHVTFTVADRDDAAARAESLGATVLRRDDTAWTRTAVIRDPQGAVFTASQFLG